MGINIPGFIRFLREGKANKALELIKQQNYFSSVCGRICSAPCETACVLADEGDPIGIRELERYAGDFGKRIMNKKAALRGSKVAIIGSGPSGLSAASVLARKGYQVTIFEALDKLGGVLRYGIPEFRIPKKKLDNDINDIKALGVDVETAFLAGQTMPFKDFFTHDFSAVLLATGAGVPKFMDIGGTNLGGVYYGEEFLMRINLTKTNIFSRQNFNFSVGQKVVVIGSGNTALDCARSAVRFGRDVSLIFQRTEEEMRVQKVERSYAKEEGIHFEPLVRPIEIINNAHNSVGGLKCMRMDYADFNKTGKWTLVPVPDSEFILEADTVIIAVGHKPNALISKFISGLKLNDAGGIIVDEETGMTSVEGVFATGNVVTDAGPVVEAIASGKKSAEDIMRFLS